MRHVPHVVVRRPWDDALELDHSKQRHLSGVLRMPEGGSVSYTDGEGTSGLGSLSSGRIARGDETRVAKPADLVVAVSPIRAKDRTRFLVEKLVEVGVTSILWMRSKRGQVDAPAEGKVTPWVVAAIEQSRRAWLPQIGSATWNSLEASPLPVVVLDGAGGRTSAPGRPAIVVIGPEGGFDDDEIPAGIERWTLGDEVLRTETAAVVAASLVRWSGESGGNPAVGGSLQ